jgi:hypothetical protein
LASSRGASRILGSRRLRSTCRSTRRGTARGGWVGGAAATWQQLPGSAAATWQLPLQERSNHDCSDLPGLPSCVPGHTVPRT